MENQHRHISGYRELDQDDIVLINTIKDCEKLFAAAHAKVLAHGGDPRDAALARTHAEDAFSRLVRAVAKPESPYGALG